MIQATNCQIEGETKRLRLNQLRTDGGTHCRTEKEIYGPKIDEYAEAMKRGEKFPPVRARYDGTDYWLSDGYLRLAAAQEVRGKTIEVEVKSGTQKDAILDAVGANADHGLPRTNKDKRAAVSKLLNDVEWGSWSSRVIAEYCRVSHTFVDKMKEELSGNDCQMAVKARRNGKAYTVKTSRIGSTYGIAPKAREIIRETDLADDRNGLKRIARLLPDEQVKVTKEIVSGESSSVASAILKIRREARHSLLEQELPDLKTMGKFRTIMCDPPWELGDGGRMSPSSHYETMSLEDIRALRIADLAADHAHLYLWVVQSIMREAFDLIEAWGFNFKSIITWVKTTKDGEEPQIGAGHYFRHCTEHILFAVRGDLPAARHNLPNVFNAPRGVHSEKPDAAYELAERMSPGPRFDMFSRINREGWTPWGKQAGILGTRSRASEQKILDCAA